MQSLLSIASAGRFSTRSRARAGISIVVVLVSLLVVALATLAVGSTVVAKRASEARDRAKKNFAETSAAYDDLVAAVATNVKPPKQEVMQPALDYYQEFVKENSKDKELLGQLANAKFHIAALQVKLGSKECVNAMGDGLNYLIEMTNDENADPASFPSLQDSALKLTNPFDWFRVKGVNQAYAIQMTVNINRATVLYNDLAKKHPREISLRDNQSALFRSLAFLQSQLPGGSGKSLDFWLKARDALETLVRDQPDNKDFQIRLAESLVNAARAQRTAKENDKATENYKRAVEVREKLAAANPDDKTIQQDLTVAKRDLDRLMATANEPAKKEEPAAKKEEAVAEKTEEPAKAAEPPAAEKKEPAAAAETPAESPAAEKEAAPAADAPAANASPAP